MKAGTRWTLSFLGFSGFIFCLLSFWGISDPFCLTSGCDVYKGYQVFGISLYLVGALVFLMMGGLAPWFFETRWFRLFTALVLGCNLIFLVFQIFLWPCISCLIVAAFFGMFGFWCFRNGVLLYRCLLWVWFLLFFGALLGAAREGIAPWPLQEGIVGEVQIFFSPSCPSCRNLLEKWIQDPDGFKTIALYPIAKDHQDRYRILSLKKNLDQGMAVTEAFSRFWEEASYGEISFSEGIGLNLKLWRNRMALAKMGESRVPLVISRGNVGVPVRSVSEFSDAPATGCTIIPNGSGLCGDEREQDFFRREW